MKKLNFLNFRKTWFMKQIFQFNFPIKIYCQYKKSKNLIWLKINLVFEFLSKNPLTDSSRPIFGQFSKRI